MMTIMIKLLHWNGPSSPSSYYYIMAYSRKKGKTSAKKC